MKTVLLIEDDRAVAATYRHKFKEAGFRVEIAPDGVEGVKLVSTLRPDAVVLDLLMPRLDGIEVLKFIRSHPELSATPVVVFSNSYMTNLVESAWRAGADECLMKATTMPAQLLEAVNKIMSRTGRRRATAPVAGQAGAAGIALSINPLGSFAPAAAVAEPAAPPPAPETNIVFDSPPGIVAATPIPKPPAAATATAAPTAPAVAAEDRFTVTYEEPPAEPARSSSGTTFFLAGTRLVAEPDTEFHAQIRELFLNGSAARLETIRELATAFVQAEDETVRAQQLDTLFRKVHALAGNAGLAACTAIAHYASTFEVLLKELRDQPSYLSTSTLNSVARAVETLEGMFVNPEQLDTNQPARLSALVVEAEAEFSRTAAAALEAARFQATTTEDPVYAIGLLATTRYDLVVTGIHLQDMTGFELLARMETLPQHANTPVMFVTTRDNFASYMLDELVAKHDLIARPFPHIELTLKALALAQRQRVQP